MLHHLTEDQQASLLKILGMDDDFIKYSGNMNRKRISLMTHKIKQKFNLGYYESLYHNEKAFYGRVSGKQKYITMLLLQL